MVSMQLGFSGIADVVELTKAGGDISNGIPVSGRKGKWLPVPVEYKRRKPKPDHCDDKRPADGIELDLIPCGCVD